MNKKLIALAVAGASLAPAAMAQTANPVTLYGRVYLTVESVEATNTARRTRIVDQASFLGVRGTEDLGGGLKAFFQLETAFAPDDTSVVTVPAGAPAIQRSATGWASRNSGVGLQGGFGSVLIGRWDTPMKTAITAVDPYGDLTPGDITGANLDQGNFSRRQDNSIQYWSPNWGGFTMRLLMTSNEGKTATADPQAFGASLVYAQGPLYLAYAYEKHEDGIGAQVGATTLNYEEEGNAVAARYKFGAVSLSASFGEYKKSGQGKDRSMMAGLEWAFGKNVLIATLQKAEIKGTSQECDMYSAGYRYDFSRRTFFIASYTDVQNDNGMNCNFGTAGIGTGDIKGAAIGLRHIF